MRVVAVVLPELALEVARGLPDPSRQGAVSAAPRGVVLASRKEMSESDLTGNVRLHAVCEVARELGISPGQTLAAARASAAELTVRLVTEDALTLALSRIAEAALAFGATVSFVRGTAGDDTVWVDVTGCAHLFVDSVQYARTGGEPDSRATRELAGEGRLLARLEAMVRGLGHTCRLALAGGPRVARAVACFGATTQSLVVPPGGDREAISALPLESLPLDPPQCETLRRLGIGTAGALSKLPRAALGARLGARAGEVMQLLDGEDRAPLTPHVPKQAPTETLELEHGTDSLEALAFVLKTLASRLALRLEGRGVGVVKLTLGLTLDAKLARSSEDHEDERPGRRRTLRETSPRSSREACSPRARASRVVRQSVLTLPTPISNPTELFVVLRARLERTVLPAPVLALTLRADECRPRAQVPQALFEPESQGSRALPLLVAELSAELGDAAVGRLTLGDSWHPRERSLLVPFFAATRAREEPLPSPQSSPEPSLLLSEPLPVERRLVNAFRFVARHEALGWWRRPSLASAGASLVGPHDVVAATVEGRAAIVEIDKSSGAAKVLGWLD